MSIPGIIIQDVAIKFLKSQKDFPLEKQSILN